MSTRRVSNRITPDAAVAALDALTGGDPEGAHADADGILRRLVPDKVNAAYERLQERAESWWFA